MRVVLVDPSRAVLRVMSELIRQGGYEVLTFSDGNYALACLQADVAVRTLITSTQPLGVGGIELCSAARNLAEDRALYVMMMSSTDDLDLVIKALDYGANDFIHKPPIPNQLWARLRVADRVTAVQRKLIQSATTDFMTGLFNRRAFFERAERACREATRSRMQSVIMVDLDNFKRINDSYGHAAGDAVLAAVGQKLRMPEAISGRLGGEEFGILIRGVLLDAYEHAVNINRAVASMRFPHDGGTFGVAASCGVAEWEPGDTVDSLMRRADVALYEAKSKGRNQVVASNTFALTKGHDAWHGAIRARRRVKLTR